VARAHGPDHLVGGHDVAHDRVRAVMHLAGAGVGHPALEAALARGEPLVVQHMHGADRSEARHRRADDVGDRLG